MSPLRLGNAKQILVDMSAHTNLLRSNGAPTSDEYDYAPPSPTGSGPLRLAAQLRRRPLRSLLLLTLLAVVVLLGLGQVVPEEKAPAIFNSSPFRIHKNKDPATTGGGGGGGGSWWYGGSGKNDDEDVGGEGEEWETFEDSPIVDLDPTHYAGQDEDDDPRKDLGADVEGSKAFDTDPNNILLPQRPLSPPPELLRPIKDRLPYPLLSTYYSRGTLNPSIPIPFPNPMDVVYLWVNASGEYFQDALEIRSAGEGVGSGGRGKRYRDNGELRGALRSAVKSLGDRLGTLHVLSGDYYLNETLHDVSDLDLSSPTEDGEADDGAGPAPRRWNMGQVPRWLNWESAKTGMDKIAWHFHSSIWRLPGEYNAEEADEARQEEEAWREVSLPNFNSFAIESRVGWINGLSETFLLANDDMFFLTELTHADFQHPLLGSVFRMDCGPGLRVTPSVPTNMRSTPGEWGGLQHAAALIKDRFTDERRMYMAHMPKALTLSLTHEASVMFAANLTESATRGFRQSKRGLADIEMSWLVSQLRIERWREALLWTWAVAKLGGQDGTWGEEARNEMAELLGTTSTTEDGDVIVQRGPRKTLDDIAKLSEAAGWEAPRSTRYYFSSMDGTVPVNLPERPDRPRTITTCSFSFARCLPVDFFEDTSPIDATEMFKHLTFVEPDCGDCLITALVTASGERGLEAFFPAVDTIYTPPWSSSEGPRSPWQREEPMLPLTSKWEDADFRIGNVVKAGQDSWSGVRSRGDGGVNLRQWCMKLLSRYAYVFGSTYTQFSQIHSTQQLRSAVSKLDNVQGISMACINDDQPDWGSAGAMEVFGQWMKKRWGDMTPGWERSGIPWAGDD